MDWDELTDTVIGLEEVWANVITVNKNDYYIFLSMFLKEFIIQYMLFDLV